MKELSQNPREEASEEQALNRITNHFTNLTVAAEAQRQEHNEALSTFYMTPMLPNTHARANKAIDTAGQYAESRTELQIAGAVIDTPDISFQDKEKILTQIDTSKEKTKLPGEQKEDTIISKRERVIIDDGEIAIYNAQRAVFATNPSKQTLEAIDNLVNTHRTHAIEETDGDWIAALRGIVPEGAINLVFDRKHSRAFKRDHPQREDDDD